ncbi:MAG TPA: hypothetical protein VML55_09900, partial [Planctomycetaceae bacterium]|nr:hypothetical protein [Planctomycetaceae bacterium]
MPLRIIIAGVAWLICGASLAQGGILDVLFPSRGGGQAACGAECGSCSDPMCPACADSLIGGPSDACYHGHLPCCADARGCRDRWRLWLTKKCRCVHHQTFYPPVPPLHQPAWGYHQTCWRVFPELPPCPPPVRWPMPAWGHVCEPQLLPGTSSAVVIPPGPAEPPPGWAAPASPEYDLPSADGVPGDEAADPGPFDRPAPPE